MGTSETSLRSHTSTSTVAPTQSSSPDTGSLLTCGKRRSSKRGRSRRTGSSSNKKGMTGGFMSVIREALVPFGIFALQKRSQSSKTTHMAMNKTKKFRNFRKKYRKSNKRR